MATRLLTEADPLDAVGLCMDCGGKCSGRWQYRFGGAAVRLPPVPFCGYQCARRWPRKQGITGKFSVKREQTVLGRRHPLRVLEACEDCATLGPKPEARRCQSCGLNCCGGCAMLHRAKGHRLT